MLDLWYKNAVIYSVNVATYMDANGDGVGDFAGLTQRLDHLAKLGATCLWLMPFYPSPRLDHGYDVTDYYSVEPELGTLGDFVEFSHQARLRGMRIIVDLPLNHTSYLHPWFQDARMNPGSPYRDYYVWSKVKPECANEGMVFPGFQSRVWTYHPRARAWYYHRFYPHQPDLNIVNPQVRQEIFKIVGFWLELGVSGFRIDAAPFMVEEVHPDGEASRRHYDFFGELRDFLSWRRGDSVLLAEANVPPQEMSEYFGDGSRLHMLFAFLLTQHVFLALAQRTAEPLVRGLRLLPKLPALAQWAQFLRNHDELDLGRLSESERADVYAAFAPDPDMRLYERGIRRRLAPMLGNDRRRIELAFSLMFSLPGTPVIYYGDELGMGDDPGLPERWPVRTCMQWSDRENGGFSEAPAERLVQPALVAGEFGAGKVNAVAQERDPKSLFNWMRRLVDARQSCPEIGWGELTVIPTSEEPVFAELFTFEGNSLLIAHNLADGGCKVALQDDRLQGAQLTELFGNRLYSPEACGEQQIELDGYGYRWFRLAKQARA